MQKITFSNVEIIILLTVVIEAFIKGILTILVSIQQLIPLDKQNFTTFKYYFQAYDDFMNFIYLLLSYYLLFIKKVRSSMFLFICFLLFFKSFMHFFVDDAFYKMFHFSSENEKKLVAFHKVEYIITTTMIFLSTIYVINYVF